MFLNGPTPSPVSLCSEVYAVLFMNQPSFLRADCAKSQFLSPREPSNHTQLMASGSANFGQLVVIKASLRRFPQLLNF